MRLAFLNSNGGVFYRGAEMLADGLADALARRGHDALMLQAGAALPDRAYRTVRIPIEWTDHSTAYPGDRSLGARLKRGALVRIGGARLTLWNGLAAGAAAVAGARVLFPMNAIYRQCTLSVGAARLAGARVVYIGGNGDADLLALDAGVDAYVAPAAPWAAWANARARHRRIAVISHGVDVARFRPDGPVTSLLDDLPHPRFLAVGALLPVKRLELAIAGVAALGRGSLTILGDGYLRPSLSRLGAERLGARFRLCDAVPFDLLPTYYRAADALVFPSDPEERFGLVLLEAMACGLPVVATDDEVRREIVGDGGLLVDPRDPAALARALDRAVTADWSGRPRRQAERLSWSEIAARYEALLTHLVE
jgi:glycosyltransferase involved in cell wall biosynthesis